MCGATGDSVDWVPWLLPLLILCCGSLLVEEVRRFNCYVLIVDLRNEWWCGWIWSIRDQRVRAIWTCKAVFH